jgi:pimeloyl-ACP methyl ester carboxylesterase
VSARYSTCLLILFLAGSARAQPPTAPEDRVTSSVFRILVQGRPVGTEDVTVIEQDGRMIIRSSGGVEGGTFSLRSAEIVYGPGGVPNAMRMEFLLRDQVQTVDTEFRDGRATSRIVRGEQTEEKVDTVSAGTVIFPNNVFGAVEGLGRRLLGMQAGESLRVYVAPQAEVEARLTAVETERIQTAGRTFEVRRHTVDVSSTGTPLAAIVSVETETGRLVRYSIPSAAVDVVREDITSVFTREIKIFRDNDEDAMIPSVGFNLAATISRPPGVMPPDAKARRADALPVAILIGGSGQADRDGTAFGVPILGHLAGSLADAGYMVVRYDKRGAGQSGGRAEGVTLADYAEDVVSVIQFLKKRKDVDRKRIALVGHSEGASVALLAAARTKDAAAVVSIAGMGTTGAELVLEQQKRALGQLSLPDDEKQQRIQLQMQIMNAVMTGNGWEDVPENLRKQADSPLFQSLLTFDPSVPLRRANQPLLVLQPELDTQVPPHHADALARLAGERRKGAGVEVARVPGVNHLLVPATTGEIGEYGTLPDKTVSPVIGERIAEWLGRAMTP